MAKISNFDNKKGKVPVWLKSNLDLFMLLLIFYICVSAMNEKKKEENQNKIVSELMKSYPDAKSADDALSSIQQKMSFQKTFSKELKDKLDATTLSKLDVSEEQMGIIISLKEDVFPLGSFEMNADTLATFSQIIPILLPYKDKVHLSFIGYADESRISKSEGRIEMNNRILSFLRGEKGLAYFSSKGFLEKSMNAVGEANYKKNTRSLSIFVEGKSFSPSLEKLKEVK